MYRAAFRARRCLVFADGFYEWRSTPSGKQPIRFSLKEGGPFAIAGIYEERVADDGSPLRTCALITCKANPIVADMHDRMPVLLAEHYFDLWLDPRIDDIGMLRTTLAPSPAEEMAVRAVTPRLNNVRNDSADLIAEYRAPEALSLL